MKYGYFFIFLLGLNSCKLNQTPQIPTPLVVEDVSINLEAKKGNNYLKFITQETLKKQLYFFASDSLKGRKTGTLGQQKAADFLKKAYQKMGIASPDSLNYFQKIPKDFFNFRSKNDAVNVVGYIKGSTYPEEVIVISAHYDHLGHKGNEKIFNGADDNGSGTIGILQIAKAFQQAIKNGNPPKRSLLFLHLVGEEIGLYGSSYYVENPIFPLKNTVVDLNIDMIGRVDEVHQTNPNYLYIIGSDKLSKELHLINEKVNTTYSKLNFDYTFNDKNDPNRFYYRSDHYNFAKNNIPIIFYFNGTHQDYHKTTDTAEKINYSLLKKRCEHVFLTAWELANRKKRIQVLE